MRSLHKAAKSSPRSPQAEKSQHKAAKAHRGQKLMNKQSLVFNSLAVLDYVLDMYRCLIEHSGL